MLRGTHIRLNVRFGHPCAIDGKELVTQTQSPTRIVSSRLALGDRNDNLTRNLLIFGAKKEDALAVLILGGLLRHIVRRIRDHNARPRRVSFHPGPVVVDSE